MRRFLLVAVVLAALVPSAPASAQAGCDFILGFRTLRNMIGASVVGACLEDQRSDSGSGNSVQQTANGLMVWRKADNWTAFTDGHRTWINGPAGLQTRLNTERFVWESDAPSATVSRPQPAATPTKAGITPSEDGTLRGGRWTPDLFEEPVGTLYFSYLFSYSKNEPWRPIADAAALRGTRVRWRFLPDGVDGEYDPRANTISLSVLWWQTDSYFDPRVGSKVEINDWGGIVGAILAHEAYHAAGPPRRNDVAGCLEEEIQAFCWEASTWDKVGGTAYWNAVSRTSFALAKVRELDALVAAWKGGRLRDWVITNPGYQRQCLGREVRG